MAFEGTVAGAVGRMTSDGMAAANDGDYELRQTTLCNPYLPHPPSLPHGAKCSCARSRRTNALRLLRL